ncbi:protein kinase [Streptomyces sp. NPDC087440]|uniref:serine/threonine-protein kinase n=1 Tax=Streptomyces sp. NPDC087440 TaxID=3365790 RepID=UPI00381F9619
MAGANGADLTGEVLGGRYRVIEIIGRGGMGVVARAVDQLLNREVAVKVLRSYTDASPAELAELRSRMRREAQAAARIHHHGVVTVHDVVEEQGLPVIVMELVDGPSLDDVLTQRGTLDPREAAAIGARLTDALDAAHRVGVLHRDVKPGNVLLERGGRVVLTDFGIASLETPDDEALSNLTQSGQIVGSLDYLAPERAQGRVPGTASDIWALGMTLYTAVEGASPFRRTSVWSTLSAIVGEPLPEPTRAGPLAPVLRALMDKDPLRRPDAARARELLEAVARGQDTGLSAAPPVTAVAPPATPVAPSAAPEPTPVPPSATSGPIPSPAPSPSPGFGPPLPPQGHVPSAPGPGAPSGPPPGAYGPPAHQPHQPHSSHSSHHPTNPTNPTHPTTPAGPTHPSHSTHPVPKAAAARRRTRTVIAVAAATVLIGGGTVFALVNARGDQAEDPKTALPSSGAPAAPDGADTGPDADDLPPAGTLPSTAPDKTPSRGTRKTPTGASPTKGGPTPPPGAGDRHTAVPPPPAKSAPPQPGPTPVSKSCSGWAHSNRSDGYGRASKTTHLYTGPYAECSFVTTVKPGTKVYFHCYVTNAYANTWIYGRISGTKTEGWLIAEKSTLDSGTLNRCAS